MRLRSLGLLLLLLATPLAGVRAQEAPQKVEQSAPGSSKVLTVLGASGYTFEQASPKIWRLPIQSQAGKTYPIVIATEEDLVVIFITLAEKNQYDDKSVELYKTLLRCNEDFDQVKITLDKDGEIAIRCDLPLKSFDGDVLKGMVNQLANVSDEVLKRLKPLLK